MKKTMLFLLFISVALSAASLHDLIKESPTLLSKDENSKNNYFTVQKSANIRSIPEINKKNIIGTGDGQKHMFEKCENEWCKMQDGGWVHLSQIIK